MPPIRCGSGGSGTAIATLPRPLWLGVAVARVRRRPVLSPRPLWQDELGGLTPVPRALIERDATLRRELGAPDVRYLLVIEDRDAQDVLATRSDARAASSTSWWPRARWPATTTRRATCRRVGAGAATRGAADAPELRAALDGGCRHALPARRVRTLPRRRRTRPALCRRSARRISRTRRSRPASAACCCERDGHWTGLVTLTGLSDAGGASSARRRDRRT